MFSKQYSTLLIESSIPGAGPASFGEMKNSFSEKNTENVVDETLLFEVLI